MLKARSDLRGYIPGQVIKLATEIHNKSGKDTGCVLASLIQVALTFFFFFFLGDWFISTTIKNSPHFDANVHIYLFLISVALVQRNFQDPYGCTLLLRTFPF